MGLSEIDRSLLARCLEKKPGAWEDFVDRYVGLVIHVIDHSARAKSAHLSNADRDDILAEVFLAVVQDDCAVLRRFQGNSTLATYLTVIARRVTIRELLRKNSLARLGDGPNIPAAIDADSSAAMPEQMARQDEVEQLMRELNETEAVAVRLFHLEGKSYDEISTDTGMPKNSVGATLSRARQKMRRAGAE